VKVVYEGASLTCIDWRWNSSLIVSDNDRPKLSSHRAVHRHSQGDARYSTIQYSYE